MGILKDNRTCWRPPFRPADHNRVGREYRQVHIYSNRCRVLKCLKKKKKKQIILENPSLLIFCIKCPFIPLSFEAGPEAVCVSHFYARSEHSRFRFCVQRDGKTQTPPSRIAKRASGARTDIMRLLCPCLFGGGPWSPGRACFPALLSLGHKIWDGTGTKEKRAVRNMQRKVS